MGSEYEIKCDKIAVIVALFKAGHSVKEISENNEVTVCSMQHWLKSFEDGGWRITTYATVLWQTQQTYTTHFQCN